MAEIVKRLDGYYNALQAVYQEVEEDAPSKAVWNPFRKSTVSKKMALPNTSSGTSEGSASGSFGYGAFEVTSGEDSTATPSSIQSSNQPYQEFEYDSFSSAEEEQENEDQEGNGYSGLMAEGKGKGKEKKENKKN